MTALYVDVAREAAAAAAEPEAATVTAAHETRPTAA